MKPGFILSGSPVPNYKGKKKPLGCLWAGNTGNCDQWKRPDVNRAWKIGHMSETQCFQIWSPSIWPWEPLARPFWGGTQMVQYIDRMVPVHSSSQASSVSLPQIRGWCWQSSVNPQWITSVSLSLLLVSLAYITQWTEVVCFQLSCSSSAAFGHGNITPSVWSYGNLGILF